MSSDREQYQSVSGKLGSSNSQQKWEALRYSDFDGKSVLDLGCNEGFFIGKMLECGASKAVGVDLNETLLERARINLPRANFIYQSWEEYLDAIEPNSFDVIIMLSALHYSKNYSRTLQKISKALKEDGVFILEASVASLAGYEQFVPVTRGRPPKTDTVFHFTRDKLKSVVSESFFIRYVGPSAKQPGDPINRFVYRLYPKKPFCLMIEGESGSGKTALADKICRGLGGFQSVSIDEIVQNLMITKLTEVGVFLAEDAIDGRLDKSYEKLHGSTHLQTLINYILREMEGNCDVVIEGALLNYPKARDLLQKSLAEKGYIVRNVQ